MKIALGAAVVLLAACGGESGPSMRLLVEGPLDDSCIGVAGFEVAISPSGQSVEKRRIANKGPVLATPDCKLPDSFGLSELPLDTPITVTVTGYDATGTSARVSGRTDIAKLEGRDIRMQLERASPMLPTLLVFYRNRFLENVPWEAIQSMSIGTQQGSKTLLNVDCKQATPFFAVEPGAFGVPTGLAPGGAATNETLTVDFVAPDYAVKGGRITVGTWTAGAYYVAN
jgi:hypothetical protein